MKEAVFVKQNTPRWETYESTPTQDPDELTERFIALTDDLSYARTFYPGSRITHYLNGLTAQLHRQLYRNQREDRSRIKTFWRYELPLLMYAERWRLLYALLFFTAAFFIGWVSAAHDDTFVRLILGDGYVNQTLRNIEQGDPLAVYKSSSSADMFLAITFNNIRVAFLAFVLGIFLSAGTMMVLMQNGIMLGAFQYFFHERGLLAASILKIWIHGTLEISAIVIAGCAGLVVGNSLLFPGTYTRLHSFRRGTQAGLKIVVGLVPVFVLAGFLESFVTRLTLPGWVSVSIIGLSAVFIGWYFVVYPRRLARGTLDHALPNRGKVAVERHAQGTF
ncbi:stage II sporulation protein M [Rhabdobacter roseus]|uniref:Putative membrane protein SpoIIM required for sporulation n=1 Tax=Rhabdobacter roseus TaxID=1655419 RepID=A0A840TVD2_9BACT|nr:stage II sporulation protein M [Rhabdobacter roseus]MBB5286855.1 putative membrane protein SpoIIM required for sporulation [Rhabdobacter roseus]